MSQWLSSLSKAARIGLLISLAWLIVVVGFSVIFSIDLKDHLRDHLPYFIVLMFGVLPIVICWGIRYVRKAS